DLIYQDSHNSRDVAPPAHPGSPAPPPAASPPSPPRSRLPSAPSPAAATAAGALADREPPGRPPLQVGGRRRLLVPGWFPPPAAGYRQPGTGASDSHTAPGAHTRATHAAPGAGPKFPLFPGTCHLTPQKKSPRLRRGGAAAGPGA
ncbi:hypothetical protein P7K49_008408, partial [Saguinus oedipus]